MKESTSRVLPSFVDISSASSFTEIPNLFASFSKSLYKEISSSVSPANINCLSLSLVYVKASPSVVSVALSNVMPYFLYAFSMSSTVS